MFTDNKILVGCNDNKEVYLLPKLANRHGLIAGATGTGKTVTIKSLAESFSDLGVPVFIADMKGDISGLAKTGEPNLNIDSRVDKYSLKDKGFNYKLYPVEFWDLLAQRGLPVRVTISEIGPLLLSRILNLTEAQDAILNIIFRIADDEGLLIIDIKDLKAMINHVTENKDKYESVYGSITTRSANSILRALLKLEDQGGNDFFGEPALELDDMIQCDDGGHGIINVLDAVKLSLSPEIYSTFLLWMLSKLYETLPEVGDVEKPKLVFFFDEAHLLFNNMNPAFLQKIEQIIRLIRSKGVGIYFISQSPSDIPDSVLSQLGNRIQHALRAYTPKDQKEVKVAAESFRPNPEFSTSEMISNLAIGEALISLLDEGGVPTIVEKVDIVPPQSYNGAIDDDYRNEIISMSIYKNKYSEVFDRESAYECLIEKIENNPAQSDEIPNTADYKDSNYNVNNEKTVEDLNNEPQKTSWTDYIPNIGDMPNTGNTRRTNNRTGNNKELERLVTNTTNTIVREASRQIVRGLFGNMKLF